MGPPPRASPATPHSARAPGGTGYGSGNRTVSRAPPGNIARNPAIPRRESRRTADPASATRPRRGRAGRDPTPTPPEETTNASNGEALDQDARPGRSTRRAATSGRRSPRGSGGAARHPRSAGREPDRRGPVPVSIPIPDGRRNSCGERDRPQRLPPSPTNPTSRPRSGALLKPETGGARWGPRPGQRPATPHNTLAPAGAGYGSGNRTVSRAPPGTIARIRPRHSARAGPPKGPGIASRPGSRQRSGRPPGGDREPRLHRGHGEGDGGGTRGNGERLETRRFNEDFDEERVRRRRSGGQLEPDTGWRTVGPVPRPKPATPHNTRAPEGAGYGRRNITVSRAPPGSIASRPRTHRRRGAWNRHRGRGGFPRERHNEGPIHHRFDGDRFRFAWSSYEPRGTSSISALPAP